MHSTSHYHYNITLLQVHRQLLGRVADSVTEGGGFRSLSKLLCSLFMVVLINVGILPLFIGLVAEMVGSELDTRRS